MGVRVDPKGECPCFVCIGALDLFALLISDSAQTFTTISDILILNADKVSAHEMQCA